MAVLAAGGCTAPALTTAAFRHDAHHSAVGLLSAVGTGLFVADLAEADRAPGVYLDVTATHAEERARSIAASFASLHPPGPASDELRAQLVPLASDAVEELASLRIAVRRGDTAAVRDAERGLRAAADGLGSVRGSTV
ncbi:hypothetical protein ADL05_18700 [Nocardiopsis sp. NRRL B-16309]|nr:hypothetical protein ADL05_18700 [Nocardiopsis sp. NRRL B-16309]